MGQPTRLVPMVIYFGWPFHGIVVGTMIYPAPWTELVFSFFRMFAVLAGGGMMFSARFRT